MKMRKLLSMILIGATAVSLLAGCGSDTVGSQQNSTGNTAQSGVTEDVEANDFTGKTVIPFCTSSSSEIGDSGSLLADLAGTGDWQEGMRFRSGSDAADVQAWVESLGL